MRKGPITDFNAAFEEQLRQAMKGKPLMADCGLDGPVLNALGAVARAYPSATPTQIALAKQRFAEQMTRIGTHKPYY